MEREKRNGPLQIRSNDSERAAWNAMAFARGVSLSALARELLNAAAAERTGGVRPPEDAEFTDELERLRIRYGVRDPAEIIRMAVMAAARRDRAGVNPWLPVALRSGEEAPSPPSPPAHPGGKRRT